MIGLTTGGLLNIALDPIFIFNFNLGIAGAAIATILSQGISFLLLIMFVLSKHSSLKISFAKISRDLKTYVRIITLGAPSLLRQGLSSVAISILNNRAALFGDQAVAALLIVGRVSMMIMSVMLGVGQGFQPVVGYNYGAKIYKRVKSAFLVTLIIGFGMMIIIAGICFAFAPVIITAFRPDDPEVIRIGAFSLRLQACVLPLMSLTISTNMLHQSLAKSKVAT
ncbi:MAG: MATE family efflux transporter, partial [Ruminiclostridium sp.]|nr:MATE family efflux transporter [Ruminiclostridium sp.]